MRMLASSAEFQAVAGDCAASVNFDHAWTLHDSFDHFAGGGPHRYRFAHAGARERPTLGTNANALPREHHLHYLTLHDDGRRAQHVGAQRRAACDLGVDYLSRERIRISIDTPRKLRKVEVLDRQVARGQGLSTRKRPRADHNIGPNPHLHRDKHLPLFRMLAAYTNRRIAPEGQPPGRKKSIQPVTGPV